MLLALLVAPIFLMSHSKSFSLSLSTVQSCSWYYFASYIRCLYRKCSIACFIFTIFLVTHLSLLFNRATSTYFASSFKETFPKFNNNVNIDGLMSGILYTIFFSICPFIFKALANYGSGATSVQHAEYNALFYYWIFILVTAFAGQFLVSMATNAYISGTKFLNCWNHQFTASFLLAHSLFLQVLRSIMRPKSLY